ncbi:methyl-accepting chemotaxis protein [Magnetospirillum fulvum]|uniref:MotA/TolQ/ExbB proton channel domain-containing protein n=1 Tax=Magnetospirillum fulvum MGU-K5 TaxID=1316936 RepID=S9TKK5_MAGFU|nr:methyl-accepting chemotaxis protein [Magnetospirillum fulvum]EPY02796.1 hypothetical protein K678_04311 [Magnetospirillum fulvum MGU-K5]
MTKFRSTFLQAIAPVVLLSVVGVTHIDFVLMAIRGNVLLNSMILVVALGGGVLWIVNLIQAERERTALNRFAREVGDGADMNELLSAPWLNGRVVQDYLRNLAQTGGKLSTHMDQSAIETELEQLQTELDSRMELPSFLVGFMIAMGLLGTFIGLLETLTGISGMLDGMVNAPAGDSIDAEFLKLVGQLRHPLAGMGIAFSASMFGLLGSLMLGMMQLTVRRHARKVLGEARHLLNRLVERVKGPVGMAGVSEAVRAGGVSESFLSTFIADLTSNMNQMLEMFHRSQDGSLAMVSRIDNLAFRLEEMVGAIESNIEAVRRTNDLLGFGPRMKETNEELLSEVRALLSNNQDRQKSMMRLTDTLSSIDQKISASNDGTRSHFDMVGNFNIQSLAKLDEAVGVLHAVNDQTSDSETKLDRRLQALSSATTNIGATMQQMTAKLSEVAVGTQTQINALGSVQQVLRDSSAEMQNLLSGLQEKMQKVQEVEIGATRHLYGIKESFDGMNALLEPLKGMAQGVGKQTSLLEATLEEMRMSQRNMMRELRAEMRDVTRQQGTAG